MLPPGIKRLAQTIFTAPLGFLHHRIKYVSIFSDCRQRVVILDQEPKYAECLTSAFKFADLLASFVWD